MFKTGVGLSHPELEKRLLQTCDGDYFNTVHIILLLSMKIEYFSIVKVHIY